MIKPHSTEIRALPQGASAYQTTDGTIAACSNATSRAGSSSAPPSCSLHFAVMRQSLGKTNDTFSRLQSNFLINDQETVQPAIRSAELAQMFSKVYSNWVSERMPRSNQQDFTKRSTRKEARILREKFGQIRFRQLCQVASWLAELGQ